MRSVGKNTGKFMSLRKTASLLLHASLAGLGYKKVGRQIVREKDVRPLLLDDEEETIRRSIADCTVPNEWNNYFKDAEPEIQHEWRNTIWPRIQNADFDTVLELAPGAGRNTQMLLPLAREIYLVDVNEYALDKCRKRFASHAGAARLHYYKNDGCSLSEIPDASVTFIYTWDSMVHFDKLVIRSYLAEFARVLKPGGTGFVHHSNYGTVTPRVDFKNNPQWRSNMTADLFRQYCGAQGLDCYDQTLIDWAEHKELDCISLFRKP